MNVRFNRFHRLVLLTLTALLMGGGVAQASEPERPPIRFGFTPPVFKNRNRNDVLASMKVWAETISQQRGLPVAPNMVVFNDLADATAALREKRVDALVISLWEYVDVPQGLLSGPYFRDQIDGLTHVAYELVAPTNGQVQQIGDLKNASITIHDGPHAEIGEVWLDAQLAAAGHANLAETAALVERNEKPAKAVLSVFFGQADACLVQAGVLAAAGELNPQVVRRLSAVAVSEPIIPAFFAFRIDLPETMKVRLFQEVMRLHESVVGAQVLKVFKSDRMQAVTSEELDRSLLLFQQWKDATKGPL